MCLAKEQGGLGFKDIQCFNQSLLANQSWILLIQPDYLFNKVFKSCYYSHSDFLAASLTEAVIRVEKYSFWEKIAYLSSMETTWQWKYDSYLVGNLDRRRGRISLNKEYLGRFGTQDQSAYQSHYKNLGSRDFGRSFLPIRYR